MYHARFDKDALRDAQPASPPSARALDLARDPRCDWIDGEWAALAAKGCWPTGCRDFSGALEPLVADRERRLLAVARGARLTALLPLHRDRRRGARWQVPASSDLFEPADALIGHDVDAAPLAGAIAALRHPLSLDRTSADSPLIPALRRAMRGRGWLSVRPAKPCPLISLDAGWRDPESRFSARRRSDFRRAARRAEAMGAVTFEILAPTMTDFDALFDEAIAVEAQSWKRDAGSALAVDRRQARFFRAYCRTAAARGDLRLSFMRIGGEAVAMQLAVLWAGRYWLFKIGHDERVGKCSPGGLLMLHTLRWAAGQGLDSYELLGEAEAWITQLWTQEKRDCVHVRTYPFTAPGFGALAADGWAWLRHRLAPLGRR